MVRSQGEESQSGGDSFAEMGLNEELVGAVKEIGFETGTEIQSMVIPQMLYDRKSDFVVASHTGSGKTLAYLLPLVQCLKEVEGVEGMQMKPKRPKAIVLGPTRELVEQIYGVSKSLSKSGVKYRSVLLTGGGDMSSQKALLGRGLDLLVGTPKRVMQHSERGNVYYGDVDVVVLDEADTMMDRGFGPEVEKILQAVRSKASPARCVLVSATMTKQVKNLLKTRFPKIRILETSTLHKGISGSRHAFLPASAGVDKLDVACQMLDADVMHKQRTMLFCNTLDSCRAVEHHLRERNIDTVCYHGDVPLEERKMAIRKFSGLDEEIGDYPPILVATDLAARGLDIPGKVDHVINFDFPLNPVDYLHRTGRTGRAGAKGKITSLVAKADQVLAKRIEEALGKGLPLDSLSADRAILPPHMRPKPETYERRKLERKAAKHGGGSRSQKSTASRRGGGIGGSRGNSSGTSGGGRTSRFSSGRGGSANGSPGNRRRGAGQK